jgi:hypothetical protein
VSHGPFLHKIPDILGGIYDIVAADKSEHGRATLAALDAVDLQTTMRAKAFFATRGFRGRYGWHAKRSRAWLLWCVLWLLLLYAALANGAPPNANHLSPFGISPAPPVHPAPATPDLHPLNQPLPAPPVHPTPATPDLHPLNQPLPAPPVHPAPVHPAPAAQGSHPLTQPLNHTFLPNNVPALIFLAAMFLHWAAGVIAVILFARAVFILVMVPLLASCATVEIRKGRVLLKYGLFSTTQYVAEVHWIREVSWSQTFVQKLMGEATIWLFFDTAARTVASLRPPGLVPLSEMQQYVDKLRNASQKLRQGQGKYFPGGFVN